ncbi:MAG: GTP-binding protein [Candidatus Heimdallarchaeota archaeon]|nr:GTP-binding protein [Candidatus Heimdallarchaeota archaeon]MCK4876697.1 GTP-binding protein [Candidatus Heimdallarchaeota archaeon]
MTTNNLPVNVVVLGLENAGKTTLLRTMAGKEFEETHTTIGMNIDIFDSKGLKFQVIDVGGQLNFRDSLWSHSATLENGVIFVFDIFDRDKLQEARLWFEYIQRWISEKATLIFLANKIDLKNENEDYLDLDEIIRKFGLDKMSNYPKRSFQIFEISAKTGDNVNSAIFWLFEKLVDSLKTENKISNIYIYNQENQLVYENELEEDKYDKTNDSFTSRIQQMRDVGIKQNLIVSDYVNTHIFIEKSFSLVILSDKDAASEDLKTVAASITHLIKSEYSQIKDHRSQFEEVINIALVRNLKRNKGSK